MTLLNKRLLQSGLNDFEMPNGERLAKIYKIINGWQIALKDRDLDKTKEKSIQGVFLQKFFSEILGYTTQVEGEQEYNLIQEPTSEIDAKNPDGALGFFSKDKKIHRVVIELKDAKTPLDKKQTSRKEQYTPVEQGFSYLSKFDKCDWLIVSNFREIRLYHKSRSQSYYEKFEVLNLHEEKELKRFYYVLCKENLISKDRNSILDELVKNTSKQEEDISKEFYNKFKEIRADLFNHIAENNPDINKKVVLEKTQKLLDRLVFVFFCEDTANLLPTNLTRTVYDLGIKSRERSDQRVWREFKNLFKDINEGRTDIEPNINAYNGGLFSDDDLLESLVIKDDIWPDIVALADYNFESDLNVNILGHIFEQSLSDLEQFKSELDGKQVEKTKTKRKKEGIYYTPEYITRYIVEQTVGKYLEEHPEKLETIKILDPACGSGAFLNQAHSFLREQYQVRWEEKITNVEQLKIGEHQDIASTNRSILLNNLFGVDLNDESTEITRLSLWLKTASKKEPLQNLDENIKCGNSLIDDPAFAGDKAFKWDKEFKDIVKKGGFDVVIGNPPYVRQEFLESFKEYLHLNYEVYASASDLYVYFFEKALHLLKKGGYFSFIVSNKFLKAAYGKKLTQYLQKNYKIVEIIDFGDLQIFEGATTYPCIIKIKKQSPENTQVCRYLKLCSLDYITNLYQEVLLNGIEAKIEQDDDSWILINYKERLIIDKMKSLGKQLNDFNLNINYGIKTGFNEAFIIDKTTKNLMCLKNPKSEEVIKPILKGEDIYRYFCNDVENWLILIPNGWTNNNRKNQQPETFFKNSYPAIYDHLKDIQSRFENGIIKAKGRGLYERDDKGDYWWELRPCSYYKDFENPKIMYSEISSKGQFILENSGCYCLNTAYIINSDSLYLLTILNSKLITFFLKKISPDVRGGYYRWTKQYVGQIPIVDLKTSDEVFFAKKTKQIITNYKKLYDIKQLSLNFIQEKFNISQVSQNLFMFYQLGANQFIEELKKQKVKLSIKEEKELIEWFKEEQKQILDIQQKLDRLDYEVDQEVYKLYNLTDEEIKLIEGSNQ